jgi:hypothetical protein
MKITLQEFVSKYTGKPVDFDGAHGCQCVDLARMYIREVWGFTKQPESVIGAADFYFKHDSRPVQRELCRCVSYSGAYPPVGSLLIFKSSGTNRYGHIAICLNADASGIETFEQDGIANEKALKEGRPQQGACTGKWLSYDRLVGWLTPREGQIN